MIAVSKTKLLGLTGMGIVLVALSVWALQLTPEEIAANGRVSAPDAVLLYGWSGLLFFGFCTAACLARLCDRRPGFVLDAKGLWDNSSVLGGSLVPWSNVAGFGAIVLKKQRLIVVYFHDREQYLQSRPAAVRWLHRLNIRVIGSPLAISANALRIDSDALLDLLLAYHQQFGVPDAA